jgi:membrane protein YdbS with pleckstrin-like domain
MNANPEPSQRLAPQARWAWRLSWAGTCLVAAMLLGTAGDRLPAPWQAVGLAVAGVALLAGTPLVPELRWRRWRWEVREHEIDLQRGLVVVRRTLIPMARVQHVETERGILGQALGLSTVQIHTAAGSHEIPLLRDGDAGAIRSRIAELARTDADEIAGPGRADPHGTAELERGGDLSRPERPWVDG